MAENETTKVSFTRLEKWVVTDSAAENPWIGNIEWRGESVAFFPAPNQVFSLDQLTLIAHQMHSIQGET